MKDNCLFCRIISKDVPAEIVFEDEDVIAFHDINPQSKVHLVVIPKKHIATLDDLNAEDMPLIGKIFEVIRDLARDNGLSGEGYRVVANCKENAGQEVFHVHFHLLGGRNFSWPPG